MSTHYKKFLRLLENWPVDTLKPGRDLGEYLRKEVKATLRAGTLPEQNISLDRQFQALENISNNIYFKKYPRTSKSSSTGLTQEQCTILISESGLKALSERKGVFG